MNNEITAYCSKCLLKTVHQAIDDRNGIFRKPGRKKHQCTHCSASTVRCCVPGCLHMAVFPKRKKKDENRLTAKMWCAEHGGEIRSFEKLAVRLRDLVEWNEFFTRETRDMRKLSKRILVFLALASVPVALAFPLAPALAARLGAMGLLGTASTGTAIRTLSGAALKSASLAYIGGGAVAAGGGAVLRGLGVIGVTGAALGSDIGGSVAQAYFGTVKDYAINRLREGKQDSLLFVNGFRQQDDDKFDDWRRGTSGYFPNSSAYGVTWESGRRSKVEKFLSGEKNMSRLFEILAPKNPRDAVAITKVLKIPFENPWHIALRKASEVGAMNADMLARYDAEAVTLMGHSLGARTIFITLLNLAEKPKTGSIKDVFLFGGAVDRRNAEEWEKAASAVSGTIWNFYSRNDQILRKPYRVANPWFGEAIGSGPIECGALNIKNVDCADIVTRHSDYKPRLSKLLSRALG